MRPHITVLTLGVSELERSLAFYRDGLGLKTEGVMGTEFDGGAVAFFELTGGLILALYPFESIARDTGLPHATTISATHTLGQNVRSKVEVDALLVQAEAAGATFIDQGRERPWGGYSGHFRDPDGHLWEIVWNPDLMPPETEGRR